MGVKVRLLPTLKGSDYIRSVKVGIQGDLFKYIDRIEGRELVRLDFERGTKIFIADFVMKHDKGFDDVKWPKGTEILNTLRVDGNRYTVLMKVKLPGSKMASLFKIFDLNVIYDPPYLATEDLVKLSAIGENESLKKLIRILGMLGKVENISFTKATFTEHDLLNVLTNKQKGIIIEAKNKGYYEYPRKITTLELSSKLGISKATTVEHLRKAEMRLMNSLLEGY